ncbi:hypothetical protein KY285_026934 [Solanum tuberosum]|nr:hypothetical protein KY285_026934 [Solanum tuberosum]
MFFSKRKNPTTFIIYFPLLVKPFAEVIKIGEMVENGIKSEKIVSQAALKVITHVIKNGSKNLGGKKINEDVANVMLGTQKGPRGQIYQYAAPQFHHYFPMQDTQYFIVPPQYAVYGAQPYAYPPNYPEWRALAYQNIRPSSQNFCTLYNPRPRQEFDEGQRPVNNFTPIEESYTTRCEYHSDALGHSTEDCRTLKSEVEKMIQAKMIMVQNDNPPNVTQNPLPAPYDVYFIEMIGDDNSLKSEEKTIEIDGAFMKANVQSSG